MMKVPGRFRDIRKCLKRIKAMSSMAISNIKLNINKLKAIPIKEEQEKAVHTLIDTQYST